jgi:hypothetical protein
MSSPTFVTARIDTVFKTDVASAQDLPPGSKAQIKAGTRLAVNKVAPDRFQHVRLELAEPLLADDGLTTLTSVCAYQPHLEVEGGNPVIRLSVPYYSQTNNDWHPGFGDGYRQCNLTSCTMLADFLLEGELSRKAKAEGLHEPESFYQQVLAKYGDTTDHNCQTQALHELGIESYYTQQKLSAEDLLLSLGKGIPVVLGVKYKTGGHIVLLVGHDPEHRLWLVHDPYGTRHGASDSYDVGIGGAFDAYSYSSFDRIFWDRGIGTGDGRIVTSVRGKPTGLPTGL